MLFLSDKKGHNSEKRLSAGVVLQLETRIRNGRFTTLENGR